MAIDERTKALALAHLKLGKSAREVSELVSISYSMAVNLKHQLAEAETQEAIYALFEMDELALNTLLDTVKSGILTIDNNSGDIIDEEALDSSLKGLTKGVKGLAKLEGELQDTASVLIAQIKIHAVLANSSDTVLNLAEALAKLQQSFFGKGTTVQVANFNGSGTNKFEEFLSD